MHVACESLSDLLGFIPALPVTLVAQHQEPEVLPVGDLLQLCLTTELVFSRLQNQGEHLGRILGGKEWRWNLHRGPCIFPSVQQMVWIKSRTQV